MKSERPAGKVFFVGSGPGDPELITVRGRRLLEEAHLVVYAGSLVKERVLLYCRPEALVRNSASMTLGEIVDLMAAAALDGKLVVRLHSGDPTFYSAMGEQAAALAERGVPCEVVPGVSSAFASAARLRRELTLPGLTQTIILTRMAGRTPVPEAESLRSLAAHNATMCIFLSVAMIDDVAGELMAGGLAPETPVAVVHRATWEDELVVEGRLDEIASKVKEAGITRQAMIIVGRVLAARGAEASRLYDPAFGHGWRAGAEPGGRE
ncbi:MAG TPA: precorrin-4 C(11)-methyltransferase [Deltaproteobacteria bacterium]|nr:precorrin-4 C(11)-methyltransferase [Deltaproteobacteria bacterium]